MLSLRGLYFYGIGCEYLLGSSSRIVTNKQNVFGILSWDEKSNRQNLFIKCLASQGTLRFVPHANLADV